MSISAQGVVERASAELSKRITGLGLRGSGKQHRDQQQQQQQSAGSQQPPPPPRSPKASVMERVTNVFCGGGGPLTAVGPIATLGQHAPEKPSRLPSLCKAKVSSSAAEGREAMGMGTASPGAARRRSRTGPTPPPRPTKGPAACLSALSRPTRCVALPAVPVPATWEQLLLEERFGVASRLLDYFSPGEKRVLAQVCPRWRDMLYRSPRHWAGLLPVLRCTELRRCNQQDRDRLYVSLVRRGFHAVCLLGATDEDALDLVTSFPAASKHIHSLSLRCSSVSDRGLETLLDHLQVSATPHCRTAGALRWSQ